MLSKWFWMVHVVVTEGTTIAVFFVPGVSHFVLPHYKQARMVCLKNLRTEMWGSLIYFFSYTGNKDHLICNSLLGILVLIKFLLRYILQFYVVTVSPTF